MSSIAMKQSMEFVVSVKVNKNQYISWVCERAALLLFEVSSIFSTSLWVFYHIWRKDRPILLVCPNTLRRFQASPHPRLCRKAKNQCTPTWNFLNQQSCHFFHFASFSWRSDSWHRHRLCLTCLVPTSRGFSWQHCHWRPRRCDHRYL